jgi:hypothetical protein
MKHLLLALTFASCAPSQTSLGRPTLAGDLGLDIPPGWTVRDYSDNARTVLQWTAPSELDRRGASVLVVRVENSAHARSTPDELGRWLFDAQRRLPQSSFKPPIAFVTANGFPGVRVEGEFVPPNHHAAYRRLHAVIVDGTSLVHVIYTARQLDRENFDEIVDSFSREGA